MRTLPSQSCAGSGTQLMMQQYREDYHMWAGRLPTWRHGQSKVNNFPTPKWWHLIPKRCLLFLIQPLSVGLGFTVYLPPQGFLSLTTCQASITASSFATFWTMQIQASTFKNPEGLVNPSANSRMCQLLKVGKRKGLLDGNLCKTAVLFSLPPRSCIISYAVTFYNLCLHSIGLTQDTAIISSHRKITLGGKFEG